MQILGKKCRGLLAAAIIVMLTALGLSFALWDTNAVKAASGDTSEYANAKVGEIVIFGRYYQTLDKDADGEYVKTPIEWLVVDKDERTGELTLMSKYILACGSFFGNNYYSKISEAWGAHYDGNASVAGTPYNQAYVDSTARAYLNNLERLDLGGDSFDAEKGYIPGDKNSTKEITSNGIFSKGSGLLSSIGYSNKRYWTGLDTNTAPGIEGKPGIFIRSDKIGNSYYEFYYQRPIGSDEYKNRPATRGFYDEAFNSTEKSMIAPKVIAGYIGHRWPDNAHNVTTKSYVDGVVDKVWLPSAAELNIENGVDWNKQNGNAWTNPSDAASSTAFEYFKNYEKYGFVSVSGAVKTTRTTFAKNGYAMNYSIPLYLKGTTEVNTDVHEANNSTDHYWTRSPSSYWFHSVSSVLNSGSFYAHRSDGSNVGVRPCIILNY